MRRVINEQLQEILDSESEPPAEDRAPAPISPVNQEVPETGHDAHRAESHTQAEDVSDNPASPKGRSISSLIKAAVNANPDIAPIAESAGVDIRMNPDGTIKVSDAMRAAMRALVPGRDKAPSDAPYRSINGWLTANNTSAAPVTETSPYFTVSHWHWLAAKSMVRQIPIELGPTFPFLSTSEAQIIHDLTQWQALDAHGHLTDEATEMFNAVTGHAELTVYCTVLLYAQRRAPVQVPAELKPYGVQAAVRDVPRVTFVVGVGKREVVSALINNSTVVFNRRLRRDEPNTDAASAVLDLLDPQGHWPAYPLKAPIVLPGAVVEQLSADSNASTLFDSEPEPDADEKVRVEAEAARERARKAARNVLNAAKTPAGAQAAISEIAGCTTHALATLTVSTCDVDVSRSEPGALALAFMRDRGIVASYPGGVGSLKRITYATGNVDGIKNGIRSLSNAFKGA
ncbi:Uncharacterised protein [Mycobacteroides abscessus subsp. bolletii]|nr:hypothetical protein [Mycobacteroides abscessus]CPW53257.1 Uncharacterised protein [Mycobacteroides abscessus]SKF43144.1 Uncharacterised protein [Mycobacteroides abscessus subsp. bolletii]SKH17484.1 Uncharacterised protein [Mycobacteroides abscessus subsp. bolletii]